MQLIQAITVGSGGTTSIDFTNIPQVYTDLQLIVSLRSTGTNGTCVVYFNNDTTNGNYSVLRLYANPSSTISSQSYSAPYFIYSNQSGNTASTFSNGQVYIPNYVSSTQKSISSEIVNENNASSSDLFLNIGKWNGTSAINRITIQQAIDTGFVQYSSASLYGILKGSGGATAS